MKYSFLTAIALLILSGCAQQGPSVDIWTAAAAGDAAAIQQHIDYGTDLDEREQLGGSTPLIIAALYGRPDVARLLVENGASLDATNKDGSTALITAAFFCRTETVAYLLDQGASLEIRNTSGSTALDAVAGEWSPELEGFYTMLGDALQLDLDLARIQAARPQVAELIRSHGP